MAEDVKIRLLLETREARSQVQKFSESLEDANEQAGGLSKALKDTAISAAKVGGSQIATAFGGAVGAGGGFDAALGNAERARQVATAQGFRAVGERSLEEGGPIGSLAAGAAFVEAGRREQQIAIRDRAAARVAARFAPLEQAGVSVDQATLAAAMAEAIRIERAAARNETRAVGAAFDFTG